MQTGVQCGAAALVLYCLTSLGKGLLVVVHLASTRTKRRRVLLKGAFVKYLLRDSPLLQYCFSYVIVSLLVFTCYDPLPCLVFLRSSKILTCYNFSHVPWVHVNKYFQYKRRQELCNMQLLGLPEIAITYVLWLWLYDYVHFLLIALKQMPDKYNKKQVVFLSPSFLNS